MMKRIALVALACPTEIGFEWAGTQLEQTAAVLEGRGPEIVKITTIMQDCESANRAAEEILRADVQAVVVCVITWSEDNYVLQLLRAVSKPLVLHSYPHMETGSLCGTMQMTSVMRDIGFTDYQTVYAPAGSELSADSVMQALDALQERGGGEKKNTFHIGAIGGRVLGMTEIAYDEFALFKKCGAVVIPISELELLDTVAEISEQEAEKALPLVEGRGFRITSSREDLLESLKYYLAMKRLIGKYRLSGLAVKCYTRHMGKVCLGYSLLSDEGYVCSCEGDVNNAVMMRILRDLTGECINNTDILNPEPETNTIIFAHCGSSGFSIAPSDESVTLCPVRLQESGVCSLFLPKTGTVTLADLVGHGEDLRMSVMVGEAVDGPMLFPGNQAKVRFRSPVLDICRKVTELACGHHWMIGYGDVSKELESYCRENGIVYTRIE